jgi:hypothetical protein
MCDPAEILLISKFSCWLVSNLTHKTKIETTNRWEAANGEAPLPITLISKSQTWSTVRSYLLHSLRAGVRVCCAFYQPQNTLQNSWAKTILLSQTGMFWLLFIQFLIEHRWRVRFWSPVELLWCSQNTSLRIPRTNKSILISW